MSRMQNGGYCLEPTPKQVKVSLLKKAQVKEQSDEFKDVLEQDEAILRQRRMV